MEGPGCKSGEHTVCFLFQEQKGGSAWLERSEPRGHGGGRQEHGAQGHQRPRRGLRMILCVCDAESHAWYPQQPFQCCHLLGKSSYSMVYSLHGPSLPTGPPYFHKALLLRRAEIKFSFLAAK